MKTPETFLVRSVVVLFFFVALLARVDAAVLTTVEYRIQGTSLQVSPSILSVPKGIPGSILVQLSGDTNPPAGTHIEAILRGPAFPARRIIGQPNAPLLLPPISVVGDYELNDIKLVDSATGATRMEGTPNRVPVRVFDEVLISRVTSRPLTLEEIRGKGIAIDENNFRAIEFEVGFVLDGKTIPVKFPVVAPTFKQSTEIIPAAELEARLAEADAFNRELTSSVDLPKELETARLNISVQGINFQPVEDRESDLALQIPPIPALVVIPGNIGFLNQFFSVQIFTENAAPNGSQLSVSNVRAELKLPPGPDLILSTNFTNPGDDPLRFARVGVDKQIQPIQSVVRPGPDGSIGTADDITRLFPGESGEGEFLVEGLQEGLHTMDVELSADLEGLAAGIVRIKGRAAGSILVRNPKFSLAFSHPRTIRTGEPYEAFVTVLNTGNTPANLVQITLREASISGGTLLSDETVVLGTLLPGETGTARYLIKAQQTGRISFSNLTTSDESVKGRFRLSIGVDERGVALSPDTLLMPDFVNALPPDLLYAANRVLGQALSIATAGQLPAGVKPVTKSLVTRRVLELAEAGQRIRYRDGTNKVLVDLLLDWQGGRNFNPGFDQIIRETDAGREFREVLFANLELGDSFDAAARLANRAPEIAGRGEEWLFASSSASDLQPIFREASFESALDRSGIEQSSGYIGTRGNWLVSKLAINGTIQWQAHTNLAGATVSLLHVSAGSGTEFTWSVPSLSTNACLLYDLSGAPGQLRIDLDCDGIADSTIAATVRAISEAPPSIVEVIQDPTVLAGRPLRKCVPTVAGFPENYGTVLAVLFSKPMTQETINIPSAYRLDNGNVAGSVQIQPGGRVALLNMREPVGALVARTMTIAGITDARGNALTNESKVVLSDLDGGVVVRGRVVRADGNPAVNVPVTLTMYDQTVGFLCEPFTVRASQVFTDTNGYFQFDYVASGIPYSVSATDTSSLSPEALAFILEAASDEGVARERLLELANSPSTQNTLLAAFAAGAMPEAIAKAEGLDRALLRDFVPVGSAREGQNVPVALRFRGRGVVEGQVLATDGVTPVPQAAVNLFPDPDSRELGRGIFADSQGRFAFFGVPLGVFSIEAKNSDGLSRTISQSIDLPGGTNRLSIVLTTNLVIRTEMRGQVTENDRATPHSSARVFIGEFDPQGRYVNVVASTIANADGFWVATNVPVGIYDPVAISFDGRRRGERMNIAAVAGSSTVVNIALQGLATVIGRVETGTGEGIVNAIVAGGITLTNTDANGFFRLNDVPTGLRSISVGVQRSVEGKPPNSNPPFEFPRFGSGLLNVLPGIENFINIRLTPAGTITGRVLDTNGLPVPNATVAIPEQGGFQWVQANSAGVYVFEGMPLARYTLSAPAPATFDNDTSGLLRTIKSGSQAEIEAAIGEAFAIFTGAADPFLNGEGENFTPSNWGFTNVNIRADRETVLADIGFLRSGTIAGKIQNSQGVPIGAAVRLTGIGPRANGEPSFVIRGDANSDPALGTFRFPGAAFVGDWGLQAASPFFPVVISTSGQTTSTSPNETNILLTFPGVREVNGRLVGTVFNPDGTTVGEDVEVKITPFGTNFVIRTETNGTYDTQIALPALNSEGKPGVGYQVEANDPSSGFRGVSTVVLLPGLTNIANVTLLGKGALRVVVQHANGSPVPGAKVDLEMGSYPNTKGISGFADTNGLVTFNNLFEGQYSAVAQAQTEIITLTGRTTASVSRGSTNQVIVRLGPTGTIAGRFVKRDLNTPVSFAQVSVGSLGFAITDTNGAFSIAGLPLGTHRLVSQDPVSGIGAVANVVLSFDGQTNNVLLVEQFRGEIRGFVVNSFGNGVVPGSRVTISFADGITPPRTVTSGPDGAFSFPATPAGPFSLEAEDPVTKRKGRNSGTLAENVAILQVDVPLESLGSVLVRVFEPGTNRVPASATVTLKLPTPISPDTDSNGEAFFSDIPMGTFEVIANARSLTNSRSIAITNVTLSTAGATNLVELALSGVGSITGRLVGSDGITPIPSTLVRLDWPRGPFQSDFANFATESDASFRFIDVPLGEYRLSAQSGALTATLTGEIISAGESDNVTLRLGESGTITGRLVRADGATPVGGTAVILNRLNEVAPIAVATTGPNGDFSFTQVPVGQVRGEAIATEISGLARFTITLTSNGQVLNLGNLRLDEEDPRVLAVAPAHTAADVPTNTRIDLFFNEPLNSNSIRTNGIFLRLGTNNVAASLQLLPDPTNGIARLVRISPVSPLLSERTYEVIAIDGQRKNALGSIIGEGPVDLVGRPMSVPFVSSFTTADDAPPFIVSAFPTNNQERIEITSVPRFQFNEPILATNVAVTLTGPNGLVSGGLDIAFDNRILTFAPLTALRANASYTLTISNVFDLAGNVFTPNPLRITFFTTDNLPPVISTLRIADGRAPIAGSTVAVEALLAGNEPGASVAFAQDGVSLGVDNFAPFRVNISLPLSGSTRLTAAATDRFSNPGTNETLIINVVSNLPPVLTFLRNSPSSGSLKNNQQFSLTVSAVDDVGVSNITMAATGSLSLLNIFPSGGQRILNFSVPANAPPGNSITFRALATDLLGLSSPEQIISLEVLDAQPPVVQILSPAENALLDPAQIAKISVVSSDNGGNHSLTLTTTGALNSTNFFNVFGAPNARLTNEFTVALASAPRDGSEIEVRIAATDSMTNTSVVTRRFRLPDQVPPTFISSSPTNGAVRQSLWLPFIEATFDEDIAAASATTNSVTVTNDAAVATEYTVQANAKSVRAVLTSPLLPGVTYTNRFGNLTDASGNSMVSPTLVAFTTGDILSIVPTNQAPVIAGQSLPVIITFEQGLGARFFRFQINNLPPVDAGIAANAETVSISIPIPANVEEATLSIRASDLASFQTPLIFDPIILNVQPPQADSDSDGMPDDFEIANNLDPLRNDATEDPDSDNFTNLQEFQAGTDPRDNDSDNDSILDGNDPKPLETNLPPTLTFTAPGKAMFFDGVNDFLQKDSPTNLNIGSSSWSIAAWISTTEIRNETMTLVSRYECGFNNCTSPDGNPSALWILKMDPLGRPLLHLRDDANLDVIVRGTNDLRDGLWHFVVATLDRVSGTVSVFVDGVEQASTNAPTLGTINDAGSPLSIGREFRSFETHHQFFEGFLREVSVWDVALSPTQIVNLRTNPPSGAESSLVGLWLLNADDSNALDDLSFNDNVLFPGSGNQVPTAAHFIEPNGTADVLLEYIAADPNNDPITTTITQLPAPARLFEAPSNTRGAELTNAPTAPSAAKLILAPSLGRSDSYLLSAFTSDGFAQSASQIFAAFVTADPLADFDGDTLRDVYEAANGLDPSRNDTTEDADSDGLTNLDEFQRGLKPNSSDTDEDSLSDGEEIAANTDPLNPDTDGDGIEDGVDPDPLRPDSDLDRDGIPDADDPDMDGDGISNTDEIADGTDPRKRDTDNDGWPDQFEIDAGSDPVLAASLPNVPFYSQPPVGIILPDAPSTTLFNGGMTLSFPTAAVLLPVAPPVIPGADGITVSTPAALVLLPAAPGVGFDAGGITVSVPLVQVLLTAPPPEGLFGGVVLSRPEVFVELQADVSALAANSITVRSITLVQGADGTAQNRAFAQPELWVVIEWDGRHQSPVRLEASTDLVHWEEVQMEILPVRDGRFRGRSRAVMEGHIFYRLQLDQ